MLEDEKTKKNSSISLIIFSVACMLGFAFLTTLILVENAKSSCVDYSECNAPQSTFGLMPGYSAKTLRTCNHIKGSNNGMCSFLVSNLKAAHDLCNINSDICSRFTYVSSNKSTGGIINFVSLKAELTRNVNSNIYSRQSGVTYTPGYIKPKVYKTNTLTNTLNTDFLINTSSVEPTVTDTGVSTGTYT